LGCEASGVSKFEFNIAIVSIIIAFALSELMAGWGRILRHRPRPRIDWVFAAWSLGILMLGISHWTGLWLYAETTFSSAHQLFLLAAPPLVLVPSAFLLSPEVAGGDELLLRRYFTEIARPFFLLLSAFWVLTPVLTPVFGSPVGPTRPSGRETEAAGRITMLAGAASGLNTVWTGEVMPVDGSRLCSVALKSTSTASPVHGLQVASVTPLSASW
jgi:hypothetical protein